MVPQWRAKAAEEKSWKFVPLLKTWLKDRGWTYAAPPAPVPGEAAPEVILSPEAKAAIEERRTKGNKAASKGDYALAKDYREQIDRIRKTGRVA